MQSKSKVHNPRAVCVEIQKQYTRHVYYSVEVIGVTVCPEEVGTDHVNRAIIPVGGRRNAGQTLLDTNL